jgi:hypothetical protein
MKLVCYPTSGIVPEIRPGPAAREWMDATPQGFAYRCLPLTIANAHGWEILSPCAFTATWSGEVAREALSIDSAAPPHLRPISHFGSGILTFHLLALLRTEPGVNLWVTGPVNRPKDGIAPLSGVIETDWAPYTFTMNWKLTRPGLPVRFEEGEPFCFFFPVARDLVEQVEPEIRDLDSEPETAADYRAWTEARSGFIRDLRVPDSPARAEKWQKAYYLGRRPGELPGPRDHRIKLRVRPFRRTAD